MEVKILLIWHQSMRSQTQALTSVPATALRIGKFHNNKWDIFYMLLYITSGFLSFTKVFTKSIAAAYTITYCGFYI